MAQDTKTINTIDIFRVHSDARYKFYLDIQSENTRRMLEYLGFDDLDSYMFWIRDYHQIGELPVCYFEKAIQDFGWRYDRHNHQLISQFGFKIGSEKKREYFVSKATIMKFWFNLLRSQFDRQSKEQCEKTGLDHQNLLNNITVLYPQYYQVSWDFIYQSDFSITYEEKILKFHKEDYTLKSILDMYQIIGLKNQEKTIDENYTDFSSISSNQKEFISII